MLPGSLWLGRSTAGSLRVFIWVLFGGWAPQRVTWHIQQPVVAGQATVDPKSLLGFVFLVPFLVLPPALGRWGALSPPLLLSAAAAWTFAAGGR